MTWVLGGFWDSCAQNMGNRACLTLSSEKRWCLCGLYSQVSVLSAWGPENWNRCLWAGRVVVGEGDWERSRATVPGTPCQGAAALQGMVTGPSLMPFTVLLRNRRLQAQLYLLYSRLTPLWEKTLLCSVKLPWDSDVHKQHFGDVYFEESYYKPKMIIISSSRSNSSSLITSMWQVPPDVMVFCCFQKFLSRNLAP